MPVNSLQKNLLLRLQNAEFAATYLTVSFEEMFQDGNTEAFFLALKNVLEARGVASPSVFREAMDLQSIHEMLSGEQDLTFMAMVSILKHLGLSIEFKPSSITAIMSESCLAKDWTSTEEEQAWRNL